MGHPPVPIRLDASEPRDAGSAIAVNRVLLVGGVSQIDPPIVQAAAVLVVHGHALRRVHDHPMHEAQLAADERAGIARPARTRGVPLVFAEPFVVGRIDRRTEPVDIDQRDKPSRGIFFMLRDHARRKLPARVLRLDRAEPSRPLPPARADQQRLAVVVHRHGKPAVRATSCAFIGHVHTLKTVTRAP